MEQAPASTSTGPSQPLDAGTDAPAFALRSAPDQTSSLSDFRGRPLILVFYPGDWSPVCSDQLGLYQMLLPEFDKFDAQLVGISVDGAWCHQAYARANQLHFPLIADFHPKGEIAKSYGAYRDNEGVAERALFILDETGHIVWSYRSPIAVNPGADGILDALERMPRLETADV